MKALALLLLLMVPTCAMSAEESKDRHPDEEFFKALGKLEQTYINGMRALAEKAVSVRICQIDPNLLEHDLYANYPEDRFVVFKKEGVYQVRRKSDPVGDREKIKAWAHAMLPTKNHAFAMCTPTPGFAVKFLDAEGATIYETTICLKCSSAAIEFPRYSARIGVDTDLIKALLKTQGFDSKEGEAASSDGATKPAEKVPAKVEPSTR